MRLTEAQRSALADPPKDLIDPEGEGVYMFGRTNALWAAGQLLGHYSRWRDLDSEYVVLGPDESAGEWVRVPHERDWLFRRRGYRYGYYTPKPNADPPGPSAGHMRRHERWKAQRETERRHDIREVVRRLDRVEQQLAAAQRAPAASQNTETEEGR